MKMEFTKHLRGFVWTRLLAIWHIMTARNIVCFTTRKGVLRINQSLWDNRRNQRIFLYAIADHTTMVLNDLDPCACEREDEN